MTVHTCQSWWCRIQMSLNSNEIYPSQCPHTAICDTYTVSASCVYKHPCVHVPSRTRHAWGRYTLYIGPHACMVLDGPYTPLRKWRPQSALPVAALQRKKIQLATSGLLFCAKFALICMYMYMYTTHPILDAVEVYCIRNYGHTRTCLKMYQLLCTSFTSSTVLS